MQIKFKILIKLILRNGSISCEHFYLKTIVKEVRRNGLTKSEWLTWLPLKYGYFYFRKLYFYLFSLTYFIKNNLPDLFQKAGLDDHSTWKRWTEINDCELNFPTEKRLTFFQTVLVVQALRPDRLQNSMRNFSCKLIGIKDISPSTTNIKMLYETETIASEPILIIISPGADPSQELSELAESVVGKQAYHEVAMGQGQMTLALDLLKQCSTKGEWLCLKNLHLVIAWLPTLEKVCL